MADSQAALGYGSVFQISDANSPDLFTDVAEITSIKPPAYKADQIDVTHMQSPNRSREFISGLNDLGECSFDINFVPGGATDDMLFALMSLPVTSFRRRNLRISFPNGVTWSFAGELTAYEPSIPVEGKMSASVKFKVSGQYSVGAT